MSCLDTRNIHRHARSLHLVFFYLLQVYITSLIIANLRIINISHAFFIPTAPNAASASHTVFHHVRVHSDARVVLA